MARNIIIPGVVILEITCADSITLINAITQKNIHLQNLTYCDDLTLLLTIDQKDWEIVCGIADKAGATVKLKKELGLHKIANSLIKRPILMLFTAFILFLTFYLPSRVLFISTSGNNVIPSKQIIEAAEECGIRLGASRRYVRSETVKNMLLQKIPELRWAGINTKGCTAIISVKEKAAEDFANTNSAERICSIVAKRDGIIRNYVVYQGNALCTVGQAVKAGQTLVSGYLDCGIIVKAMRANAEVNALTFHTITAISPEPAAERGAIIKEKTKYSLQIGKKLINFFKDSGNLDVDCVKIYEKRYLELPGGFRLPICLIKQTLHSYQIASDISCNTEQPEWIENAAKAYLQSNMIAGSILSENTQVAAENGAYHFYGRYTCTEMIGQVKYEQITSKDGKYD